MRGRWHWPSRPGQAGTTSLDDAEDRTRVDAARWGMLLPHRELAVAMVLRATGDIAEAEDCVHDAMLRLVRRADLDPARVRSLLVRAALHIAIDHRRAAGRRQTAVLRLGGGAAAAVTSPEMELAQREEAERLRAAIDRLPRREREVMLLRLAGLNVAETARRLGISVKSVEGAYTRARSRIRLLLAGIVAWVLERIRRHSTQGDMVAATTIAVAATATTVAAYVVFDHTWIAGGPAPARAAATEPDRPARFPAAVAAEPVDAADPPGAHLRPPGAPAGSARGTGYVQDSRVDLTLFPHYPSGFKKHDPPPDCNVCVPIDAPLGLASTGIYVTLGDTNPQDNVQAWEDCVNQLDPGDPTDAC